MPDSITFDLDTTAVDAALATFPDVLRRTVNAACETTANAIAAEARNRLSRQLKGTSIARKNRPDLGQNMSVEGIRTKAPYDGNGWLVYSDREPFPNVELWLEKGTRAGKRRNFARTPAEPFFYVSIALEVNNHERRLIDAMQEAASETGLGG